MPPPQTTKSYSLGRAPRTLSLADGQNLVSETRERQRERDEKRPQHRRRAGRVDATVTVTRCENHVKAIKPSSRQASQKPSKSHKVI